MDCPHCAEYIDKSRHPYPRYCHWHAGRPETCSFFERGAPYVASPALAGQPACFGCDWSRFDAPDKARCLAQFPSRMQAPPPVWETCELYLPRRWGHFDCPGCHSALSVVSNDLIVCEKDHSFHLARGKVVTCTGCGAQLHPYTYQSTDGTCDTWYQVTIHFCPRCGWGNYSSRYNGPAGARSSAGRRSKRAAGRHTGRLLTY